MYIVCKVYLIFLNIFVLFLYFIILKIVSAFDSFFINTYVFNNYINICSVFDKLDLFKNII